MGTLLASKLEIPWIVGISCCTVRMEVRLAVYELMMMSTTNSHMMSTALPKVLFTLSPVNPTFPTSQISTVTILDDENIKWAFMQIHACHKVQMDTQT